MLWSFWSWFNLVKLLMFDLILKTKQNKTTSFYKIKTMANINYQLLTAACDSSYLQGNYWSWSPFYFPVTCYLRLPKLKASVLADVKCCWWSTNVIISKTGSYVGEHAKCEWIPWRRKLTHAQGRTLNSSIFFYLDALKNRNDQTHYFFRQYWIK